MSCPFCSLDASRKWIEHEHAIAFADAYPVADGHTLVAQVRERLLVGLKPDGFNIGVNDGAAAGQTVEHAHVHIIPRRNGDVTDPRGGIRWIIDDKANYWSK
jgi:diadenosine tetraphosphate (Ap4A) HIT family hydrolase